MYKKTLKKKPDAKRPHILKNHLILEKQSYKIEHDTIRVPIGSARYVFIKLTRYVNERIKGTKIGSLTITNDKLIIFYSKDISEQKPDNFVGIDRNLDNVTTWDSKENCVIHDLSKA